MSGESAGAIAIGPFLVAGRGKAVQHLNLFRGAIMESGAPSGYAVLSFSRQALMNYHWRLAMVSRPLRTSKIPIERSLHWRDADPHCQTGPPYSASVEYQRMY